MKNWCMRRGCIALSRAFRSTPRISLRIAQAAGACKPAMLVGAEVRYRDGLLRHREWIIERKAAAKAQIKQLKEETEGKARELQDKLARERIERLLGQAKALERTNQIRAYVGSVALRAAELSIAQADFEKWAMWARQEADRIAPVKNDTVTRATNSI